MRDCCCAENGLRYGKRACELKNEKPERKFLSLPLRLFYCIILWEQDSAYRLKTRLPALLKVCAKSLNSSILGWTYSPVFTGKFRMVIEVNPYGMTEQT